MWLEQWLSDQSSYGYINFKSKLWNASQCFPSKGMSWYKWRCSAILWLSWLIVCVFFLPDTWTMLLLGSYNMVFQSCFFFFLNEDNSPPEIVKFLLIEIIQGQEKMLQIKRGFFFFFFGNGISSLKPEWWFLRALSGMMAFLLFVIVSLFSGKNPAALGNPETWISAPALSLTSSLVSWSQIRLLLRSLLALKSVI